MTCNGRERGAKQPELTLGRALTKPEGAHWADPLQVIERLNFRADEIGELRPGYSHVFVVSADGGTPRQLTFGPYSEAGPLSWSPDGDELLLSGNRTAAWAVPGGREPGSHRRLDQRHPGLVRTVQAGSPPEREPRASP
jgi:hypothetical protein